MNVCPSFVLKLLTPKYILEIISDKGAKIALFLELHIAIIRVLKLASLYNLLFKVKFRLAAFFICACVSLLKFSRLLTEIFKVLNR